MSENKLLIETAGGVARLTLNRPQVMNALTPDLLREIKAAVEQAGQSPEVGVIVLTGAGRAFSAGVDLKALGKISIEGGAVGDVLDGPARALIQAIEASPRPVIARVNGYCFTGALEIALACDMIVAAEEARLGDTHTKWGLRPSWGMSRRLPLRVGPHRAKEMSFTARAVTGAEAERMGLVNRAVPLDKLDEVVDDLCQAILANSREAIAAYKTLYNQGAQGTLAEGLRLEESSRFDIRDAEERLKEFLSS